MTLQNMTHKKAMIEALEKSLGIVSTACKEVGITRQTHYLWLENDLDYKKEVESIKEMTIDFVESSLYKQIKENNTTATIFFLKTQGKKRGYVETTEPVEQKPNEIQINVVHKTLDT